MALTVSPRSLENYYAQLAKLSFDGGKEVARLTALAECSFRLAVHPDTRSQRAIALLEDSIRIDGANPKYPYHLARIHFQLGNLHAAARWFRLACCLTPTSHRIWTHVAILLQELNEVYRGDENFEPNVLQQRADKISAAVQRGDDHIDADLLDFVPPKSRAALEKEERQGIKSKPDGRGPDRDELRPTEGVRRYLNARKCRWSGIEHLSVERLLRSKPTQANVKIIAPILERLANAAALRPGGPAAVASLMLQWLVAGYPVETIRRLMSLLPPQSASQTLLDRVCGIFEAPLDSVAERIAIAVDCGELPPLLAALVHRQRLMWQPLEFRSLSAYRAARSLLAEIAQRPDQSAPLNQEQLEAVRDLIRRLDRAAETLEAAPPKSFKDEVPEVRGTLDAQSQAASLRERFTKFVDAVTILENLKDEGFRLIKDRLEPQAAEPQDDDALLQAIVNRDAADRFVRSFAETVETCQRQFSELCDALTKAGEAAIPADFAVHCEDCNSRLQSISNFGKFTKVLKRIDKQLQAASVEKTSDAATPAAEWTSLHSALAAALPKETATGDSTYLTLALDERFATAETQSSIIEGLKATISAFLRDQLEPAAASPPEPDAMEQVRADADAAEKILEQLSAVSERRMQALELLGEELTRTEPAQLPSDCDSRLESSRNRLRAGMNLGPLRKRMKRIQDRLPQDRASKGPGRCASTPLVDCKDQLERIDREDATATDSAPNVAPSNPGDSQNVAIARETRQAPPSISPPPKPQDDAGPASQLNYSLLRVDWAIQSVFAQVLDTFRCYPEWIQQLPPYEALRRNVMARYTETTYRLGRRKRARAIWNRMLKANRLDINAMKNIAVCDTIERDASNCLTSWREYVELLYQFDVLAGSPNGHAEPRAQFHRAFGNSYAPAFLSAPFDNDWSDSINPAALIAFLSSPGRLRNLLDHRLLEYLNTRFQFQSPSLALGIKRVDCERHLDGATKAMTQFVSQVAHLLPRHTADAFARVSTAWFEKVSEKCRQVNRLTLKANPRYEQEETQQITILVRMFDLKLKLLVAFNQHQDMVKNVSSFEFLKDLNRLDAIPLSLSQGLLSIVANSLGIKVDFLEDLTDSLRTNVVASLIKYLIEDDDPAELATRSRQYELLATRWLSEPGFEQCARLLDFPPPGLMPKEVSESIERQGLESVLPQLERWHDAYPAMARLAIVICQAQIKEKRYRDAMARLEATLPVAIVPSTRRSIRFFMVQVLNREVEEVLDDERYEDALKICIRMVEIDDCRAAVVTQTIQLYDVIVKRQGTPLHKAQLQSAVQGWLSRASVLLNEAPTEDDEMPRPTEEDLEVVRKAAAESLQLLFPSR